MDTIILNKNIEDEEKTNSKIIMRDELTELLRLTFHRTSDEVALLEVLRNVTVMIPESDGRGRVQWITICELLFGIYILGHNILAIHIEVLGVCLLRWSVHQAIVGSNIFTVQLLP